MVNIKPHIINNLGNHMLDRIKIGHNKLGFRENLACRVRIEVDYQPGKFTERIATMYCNMQPVATFDGYDLTITFPEDARMKRALAERLNGLLRYFNIPYKIKVAWNSSRTPNAITMIRTDKVDVEDYWSGAPKTFQINQRETDQ